MIGILVTVIVALVVVGILLWAIQVIRIIVVVMVALWLLGVVLGMVPMPVWRR